MIEIKVDTANDQKYIADELETTSVLDMYVDQILMAMGSELGSIMGADVTLDLESMVFEMNLTEQEINGQVRNVVSNFCSLYSDFQTDITTRFAKGETRDWCLVEITVNKERKVGIVIK